MRTFQSIFSKTLFETFIFSKQQLFWQFFYGCFAQSGKKPFLFPLNFVALHLFLCEMKKTVTISALTSELNPYRERGCAIGFVPTMGALHQGHLSLIERSVRENECTVVSIFVNPTQFNNLSDLEKYPRTLEADIELLEKSGCDILFAPSAEEVYPEPDMRQFDFGTLDKVMEGAFRPGHFNGVAQVVSKLFDMVQPHHAYFGEKDFQQLAVIRAMVAQLAMPVEVIACPIVREPDGLAMSSRNMRLLPEQREIAPVIAETLKNSRNFVGSKTVGELTLWVAENINARAGLEVEYFQIVDGDTLLPVAGWEQSTRIVGCIAVFCGEVRLIDIVRYK